LEDINRLLEKLNIDTKNGVLFYEVKVRGRVSGLEPPRAEYELKENIVLNGLMTDFICGNPNSKKFLHIKIIPVWSAALARKLVIISVACIFAFLRDAFDGHVTVRVTTRAVSTLE